MSEYKNTFPDGKNGVEKPGMDGTSVANTRADVRTGVAGALQPDLHAEAVRLFRERLPMPYSECSSSMDAIIKYKNELLRTDPSLLDDDALKKQLVECAIGQWSDELPRLFREFDMTTDDVQRLAKPLIIRNALECGGGIYDKAATVFPGLEHDPEWHEAARQWYAPLWRKGAFSSALSMRAPFFGPEFYTADVVAAAAEGIGICVARVKGPCGVTEALHFLEAVGDAAGHRAVFEKAFDDAVALRAKTLARNARLAGLVETAQRGEAFAADPAVVRTREGRTAFDAWERDMRRVAVLEKVLRDHSGDAFFDTTLGSLDDYQYRDFPEAALAYSTTCMRDRLPGLKLQSIRARMDRSADNAYFNHDTDVIGLPPSIPLSQLFEAIGEEIGHAARYELGPQSVRQELVTHEFFGYLGRRILLQATKSTSMAGYFRRNDGALGIDEIEDVNLMYYARTRKGERKWQWGRKLWRNARQRVRSQRLIRLKDPAAAAPDPIEDMDMTMWQIPAGKERDLAEHYRTSVIHQRGYKYAAMHFTPEVMERLDVGKIFALPDQEVRRRFFRPDPDFDGLWLQDS